MSVNLNNSYTYENKKLHKNTFTQKYKRPN